MATKRDTYKFEFKVGNLKVHCGITNDLHDRENRLRNSGRYTVHNGKRFYWKEGHIVQVGHKTTREAGLKWKAEHGCHDH